MTEKTEKKLDKITKYGSRIIWIAISAIVSVFCVSHYESASKSLDAWRKYPEVVNCVEKQPQVDSGQNMRIEEMSKTIQDNQQTVIDMKKDLNVTLMLLLNSTNEVRDKLDLYPLVIPARQQETVLIEKAR